LQGRVSGKELLVSDYRTYAGSVSLRPRSFEMLDRCSAVADALRARAARYRRLAETLLDPRVIAVVLACAMDLETQAILSEAADAALGVI
jgi:hypothetical protein